MHQRWCGAQLGDVTVARGLQWSQVLLNTTTLASVSRLMTQLEVVCLNKSSCTLGAAKAFVTINLQLETVKVSLARSPEY